MRVLVACEFSGTVRDAFTALGHEAWSCDLLPTDSPGLHYQGDVTDLLEGWTPVRFKMECDPQENNFCQITQQDADECKCYGPTQDGIEYTESKGIMFGRPKNKPHWDLMIAHPPCTYLSVSGMHWTTRGIRDPQLTEDALKFVQLLMKAPIKHIAIENPISVISSRIRKPDQIINPYEFGHDASKKTCLWLKNLPVLNPTKLIAPRVVITPSGKPANRWGNQCSNYGQDKLPPSPDRWKIRSKTYQGIADAMAAQWGAAL